MNINKFIQEVHENSVRHGWWESERPISETISLIHSEWSEALEEARAGRPMEYVVVNEVRGGMNNYMEQVIYKKGDGPAYDREIEHGAKPEGIAVELMDGVIRILDLFGKYNITCTRATVQMYIKATRQANPLLNKQTPISEIIAAAHSLTAKAGDAMLAGFEPSIALSPLEACMGLVMWWVSAQGEDTEAILVAKHKYNLSRPYKHGKKF